MELGDDDLLPEFQAQIEAIEKSFDRHKTDLLFSGEYDNRSAIYAHSAGVGGLDAQDLRRCWSECICAGRKSLE